MSRSEIDKATINLPKSLFPAGGPPGGKIPYLYPVIIACFAYRPSFANAEYHTGYVFTLTRANTTLQIDPKGPNIPAKDLRLNLAFPSGIDAK